ncbi:MAG: hypothetical protein WCN95_11085 [bacterium]
MLNGASVKRFCFLAILVTGISAGALAAKEPATVIVAPARERVVQLVQDMFRLRELQMVSYQSTSGSADPVLYRWNGKTWKRITVEEFQATLPQRVVLIGDQKSLPAALVEASSRSEDTRGIQTFDVTAILSALSKLFDLSHSEMTALASRNGVVVVDKNEDLRRYGKYYPGPGYDQLQGGKSSETSGKSDIPPEPELVPIKIEPVSSGKTESVDKTTPVPVVVPSKEKAKVEITPDDK